VETRHGVALRWWWNIGTRWREEHSGR
jgi:hypothetical protein